MCFFRSFSSISFQIHHFFCKQFVLGSKKKHRLTRKNFPLKGGILEIPLDPAGEEDTSIRHGEDAPEAWLKMQKGGGCFCPDDWEFPIRLLGPTHTF